MNVLLNAVNTVRHTNYYTIFMSSCTRTLHSVVDIPILEGSPGTSLPFLLLEDGELSFLALAWARHKRLTDESSPGTLAKAMDAIGLIYDYYIVERKGATLAPNELLLLLQQFYQARRYGLASLGWKPVSATTASNDVQLISQFTEWCSENFESAAFNPKERLWARELNLHRQRAFYSTAAQRRHWDILYHLNSSSEASAVRARKFNPGKRNSGKGEKKPFPAGKVRSFLEATKTIRDKLYFLLLFFGGLRISEPLHLFASDISVLPDGTAKVTLANPQDGIHRWIGADNKVRVGNRAAFLLERYGTSPRSLLAENHPLHAGWKGMAEDDRKNSTSELNWLTPDASRLFARLHTQYIKDFRGRVPDSSPYYFLSKHPGSSFGKPLKLSNISQRFYSTANRIGLLAAEDGVNPHGARHFYGYYCASILRLPVETTQKLMHHIQMSSTQVYYHLTTEAAREALLKAHPEQKSTDCNIFLPSPFVSD